MRRAIRERMPRRRRWARQRRWSYALSARTLPGRRRRRPVGMQIAGMSSSTASNMVQSLALAALTISDSGSPSASPARCSLDPRRPGGSRGPPSSGKGLELVGLMGELRVGQPIHPGRQRLAGDRHRAGQRHRHQQQHPAHDARPRSRTAHRSPVALTPCACAHPSIRPRQRQSSESLSESLSLSESVSLPGAGATGLAALPAVGACEPLLSADRSAREDPAGRVVLASVDGAWVGLTTTASPSRGRWPRCAATPRRPRRPPALRRPALLLSTASCSWRQRAHPTPIQTHMRPP